METELVPFEELTAQERGASDPAVEFVPGSDETAKCRYINLSITPDDVPELPPDEELVSCWEGEGGVVYGLGVGPLHPACGGDFMLGLAASRIVGCWHSGAQFVDESKGNLDDEVASVAFSWDFESISQVIVGVKNKRFGGLTVEAVRLFGGERGDSLVIDAIASLDNDWNELNKPLDPNESQLAFASGLARAWATHALQNGSDDRDRLERMVERPWDNWDEVRNPFPESDQALVIKLAT